MLQSAAFPAREQVSRELRTGWGQNLADPAAGAWARRIGSLALLAFSLVLGSCESPPPPPLVLGVNSWVGYDPLVLARDRDMIDTAQIKVVELSSSSETMRGFRNGLIDAAALTLDEALRLAGEGQDLRLVALLDASAGADVVLARSGIGTLQALRGETIAVERSAVGALMLTRLLQKAGLRPADVNVLNLEASLHLDALRDGKAGAAISYQPLASALKKAGFHVVFDSAGLSDELFDVLVVRASALRERPAQVDALIAGWREGLRALERDRAATAADMARGTDMTPEEYVDTLGGLAFYEPAASLKQLTGQPPPLVHGAERLVQTLISAGLLDQAPDWGRLIDPEPARRVMNAEKPS
ncbi:NitT/TauT family transport system substrate-binding protein [Hydrogenophaga palleronii]|uniref:NitT/TauT family transport system substrate-binding protein n=1 Tax=Hydrogenophaga palleronii TaxID=65655 RepID=A0ABU1WNK0_9BURK|nr:ABC transporter substrate-binding protein [Hydrogenophaga palleronii]MDR7150875.1 NitT/TauT family transport system substrate-binding protein [Hydrogenophaga palleronii]